MKLLIVLLFCLLATSQATLLRKQRGYSKTTVPGSSVGTVTQGTGSAAYVSLIIYYFDGNHIGNYYGTENTIQAAGVPLDFECKNGKVYYYQKLTTVGSSDVIATTVQTDPPELATPIHGATANQKIGCHFPGSKQAHDSLKLATLGYSAYKRALRVYLDDSSCSNGHNLQAEAHVLTGTSVTTNILGQNQTLTHPFVHSSWPCVQSSVNPRIYYKLEANNSNSNLYDTMNARGYEPYGGSDYLKICFITMFFFGMNGLWGLNQLLYAFIGPLPSKLKLDDVKDDDGDDGSTTKV